MKTNISPGNYTEEACLHPEEKIKTRNLIFNFAERSATLLDSDGRLSVPIIELCGKKAPLYDMIKKSNKIGVGGFYIGVDIHRDIVEECKSIFSDSTSLWINSRMGEVLLLEKILQVKGCQILILDSHYGVHRKNYHKGDIIDCIAFAKKQKERLGEFLLVINICNSRYSKDSDIERYCNFLSKEVGRAITKEDFIFYKSKKEYMMWVAISFGF